MSGSTARWRFAVGDWYAVLGDEVGVVLPPSARDRVASLWEVVDGGADADEVLDAVLAGGLSGLSDLVLVSLADGGTRVLVRGGASATLHGSSGAETISAEPGVVWFERTVPGRTSGRLTLAGDEPADCEVAAGLVRVSALELPTAGAERGTGEGAGDSAGAGTATEFSLEAQPPQVLRAVPSEPVAEPVEVEADGHTDSHPGSYAEAYADEDDQTAAGAPPVAFDRPPVPGQEQAPPVVPAPVATLVFSTGEVVEVDRAVLVGRAPEARRFASHEQPRTVAVPSPNQEISSTHLEIRPGAGADLGSAIATDLGSTNGTVLVQPGLPPEDLQPGIAVSLVPGAVIDLGDGVIIQVTNP